MSGSTRAGFNPGAPYWVALREAEKRVLAGAYEQAGSASVAAAFLGIAESYFRKRCLVVGVKCGRIGRPRTRDLSRSFPQRYDPGADGLGGGGDDD